MLWFSSSSAPSKLISRAIKLRVLGRCLLERRFAETIRYRLWLRNANRDSLGSSRIAELGGYADLDSTSEIWRDSEKLKTMFLLGSGSSVNELDDECFQVIRDGISIGINAWALHAFVPDCYSFETGQDGDGPSDETKFISAQLERPSVVTKNPRFMFLRPTPPATVQNLVRVPQGIGSKPVIYGRCNVVTQSRKNLQSDLRRIARAAVRGRLPANVLLDNGASVIRLIWLSALQGIKNVVLVGIDLNSSPYFWYQNPESLKMARARQLVVRPTGTVHNSLETSDRPFPVDFFIEQLATVVCEEMGTVLWASSHSSSLSRFLPVYPWKSAPSFSGAETGL